jgi:hypothetical protein
MLFSNNPTLSLQLVISCNLSASQQLTLLSTSSPCQISQQMSEVYFSPNSPQALMRETICEVGFSCSAGEISTGTCEWWLQFHHIGPGRWLTGVVYPEYKSRRRVCQQLCRRPLSSYIATKHCWSARGSKIQ